MRRSTIMVTVQIFGVKNSQATRAAERFFKERRATIQMVDLKKKAIAPGEIKRFSRPFRLTGVLDTEGKAYVDAGLNTSSSPSRNSWRRSSVTRLCSASPWSAAANS